MGQSKQENLAMLYSQFEQRLLSWVMTEKEWLEWMISSTCKSPHRLQKTFFTLRGEHTLHDSVADANSQLQHKTMTLRWLPHKDACSLFLINPEICSRLLLNCSTYFLTWQKLQYSVLTMSPDFILCKVLRYQQVINERKSKRKHSIIPMRRNPFGDS